jgi:acetyl esterase
MSQVSGSESAIVDHHLAAMLSDVAAGDPPPLHSLPPDETRHAMRQAALAARGSSTTGEDLAIERSGSDLPVRIYRPSADGPHPIVAFFHGGGWVLGDLETHDSMARHLCDTTRTIVVAVDYRLAPEHPFPAAVHDALDTVRWIHAHAEDLGGDTRVAVAGESAGGNLAAVAAQLLRDEGVDLAAQFLIYPVTDLTGSHRSRTEFAGGPFIDAPTLDWFERLYVPGGSDLMDPRLSPLRGDLHGLPPTVLVTAEVDPLRDEGEAYADALRAAGVTVVSQRCSGMIHAFFDMGAVSPAARTWIDDSCGRFADLVHAAPAHRS